MSTTKCTMLIEQISAVSDPTAPLHRIGGWSESWYDDGAPAERVRADFEKLCQKRAALLGKGAVVVGQRYQQVDPSGAAKSTSRQFPGNANIDADVPAMALLCKVPGLGVKNVRNMILRGFPDAGVVEGELKIDAAYKRALTLFFNELADYQFRGKDLDRAQYQIDNITADGHLDTELANPIPPNIYVRVLRTMDLNGKLVGGRFRVSAATVPNHLVLVGWPYGPCKGGKVVQDEVIHPTVDAAGITISRIIQKKVGGNFTRYVGRHSKKK